MAKLQRKCLAIIPLLMALTSCVTAPNTGNLSQKPDMEDKQAVLLYTNAYDREAAAKVYRDVIKQDRDRDRRFIARWRLADLLLNTKGGSYLNDNVLKGAEEAVSIYEEILANNENREIHDALYYQLAKAYEKSGRLDDEVEVLGLITHRFPESKYATEALFRRAEVYFDEGKFDLAINDYRNVVAMTEPVLFKDFAWYKMGWAYLLIGQYEKSVNAFIELLDRNEVIVGNLYKPPENAYLRTMTSIIQDSVRTVTLAFSYFDDKKAIERLLMRFLNASYADIIYEALARHYQSKQRYADAAGIYIAFYESHPLHRKAPYLLLQAHEIYSTSNLSSLALKIKHDYVKQYGIGSDYWNEQRTNDHPQLIKNLKQHLYDLASYYHARAQKDGSSKNYLAAEKWYQQYIDDFPNERDTPRIHFLLAELIFETGRYERAISEYGHVAYDYPLHGKAAEAGYAELLAYEEVIKQAAPKDRDLWERKYVESLLKFSGIFRRSQFTGSVLAKSSQLLLDQGRHEEALVAAYKAVKSYIKIPDEMRARNWIIIGDIQFDNQDYPKAEAAYRHALNYITSADENFQAIKERYALSVYKQGVALKKSGDIDAAVAMLLRIRNLSSDKNIVFTTEQEIAVLLMENEQWDQAVTVLNRIQLSDISPGQDADISSKLAYAYQKSQRLMEAAETYERLGRASNGINEQLRKEAIIKAAELYDRNGESEQALNNYKYLFYSFSLSMDENLEVANIIASKYKQLQDDNNYYLWLNKIIAIVSASDSKASLRNRTWAAKAILELAKPLQNKYQISTLELPLEKSLRIKKKAMEEVLKAYGDAVDYDIAEVTTEATFYIAELYHDFGRALLASQRPENLSEIELEQYEILLEEQAYPFEEQAISLHQVNHQYLYDGIFNQWVKSSLEQLAELMPVRYERHEIVEAVIDAID